MSTLRNRPLLVAASLVGLLIASGCGASPGSQAPASSDAPIGQSLGSLMPAPPEGRVIGTGMVLDTDGEVQLCLGAIMESFPPQCHGVPLDGWSWEGVDGSESSDSIRWGSYAVYATYDGERLTVTDPPILLALYDPIAPPDPTGGVAGTTPTAELERIKTEISDRLGMQMLGAYVDQGYVWLDVVWDDGTWQQAAADDFGDDVVIVRSALREIDD